MKIRHLLGMAVLGLMAAACSNDVNDVLAPEAPQKGIPFVATIAPKTFDATTRTELEEKTDGTLSVSWKKGDEILLFDNKDFHATATVKNVASDGSATIEATFTEDNMPTDGSDIYLFYPFSAYSMDALWYDKIEKQDGTLSGDRDVRLGVGKFKVDDDKVTLESSVELNPYEVAICKFSFNDISGNEIDVKKLVISYKVWNNPHSITITPTDKAQKQFYVTLLVDHMKYMEDEYVWFEAISSDDTPYIAKGKPNNMEEGKFYQTTLKMATLGDLMNSDGTFSATAEEGKTPIGVIAYLGNDGCVESTDDGGGHGLVLALKNAAKRVAWSTDRENWQFDRSAKVQDLDALFRTTDVSGYTNTKTLVDKEEAENVFPAAYKAKNYTPTAPTSTAGWFLPSMQQWVKMMTGLGGLSNEDITSFNDSYFDNNHTAADKWEAALEKAGEGNYDSMTSGYQNYWSSSEYSNLSAVLLDVDAGYGFFVSVQFKDYDSNYNFVRPILAF